MSSFSPRIAPTLSALVVLLSTACGPGLAEPEGRLFETSAAVVGGSPTDKRPEIGQVINYTASGGVLGCTGTLIAGQYVLTALHCLMNIEAGEFEMTTEEGIRTMAMVDYRVLGEEIPKISAKRTLDGNEADVALIRLEYALFPHEAQVVALADELPRTSTQWSTVFGYGGALGKSFRSFQGPNSRITENGDSGGPFLHGNGDDAAPLWGTVSGGSPGPFGRDLFSNITYFKEQLAQLMRKWDHDIEYGMDRPGGDYASMPIASNFGCRSACLSDGRCLAWTWSSGTCHLKEVIPNFEPKANTNSGLIASRRGDGVFSQPGWDRLGADYSIFTVDKHGDCTQKCSEDARCRAFATREETGGTFTCFLKEWVPNVTPMPGVRSERKFGLELETDRPGNDYRVFDISQYAPELCQAECARDSRCRSWTFSVVSGPSASKCYLKDKFGTPTYSPNHISGERWAEYR